MLGTFVPRAGTILCGTITCILFQDAAERWKILEYHCLSPNYSCIYEPSQVWVESP